MSALSHPVTPCCWYDGAAPQAAALYAAAIPGSAVTGGNTVMTSFTLGGEPFLALNGGPKYAPNPSISFFVVCDSVDEADRAFAALSGGGVLMPIGSYPWAERYGWCADRWGVSWQVAYALRTPVQARVAPMLMFTQAVSGMAEEAIGFYTKTIPGSSVVAMERFGENEGGVPGTVKHAQFLLGERLFLGMDGGAGHAFTFSEGVSLVLHCATQEEIDLYWERLTEGGSASMCGWLRDRYGVSWQVVPTVLAELMADPARAPRVVQAFLAMKKFDIAALLRA